MNVLRWVGLGILGLGMVLIISVLATPVNPNIDIVDLGFLTILFGALVLALTVYRKRVPLRGSSLYFATGGWLIMSAGLLIGFFGYLLASQLACFCPANGPCSCGVPLYNLMVTAGVLSAVAGGILVVISRFLRRSGPVEIQPPSRRMLGSKATAAVELALTAVVVFSAFSYYPGVYVTSIFEASQLPPGVLENLSPGAFPISSLNEQSQGGFQIPVGGTFNYIILFKSLSSFPNYTISQISMGYGFSIVGMNDSLPLRISVTDPTVSVAFTVRGPFYPYYGPVSFQINITK